MSKIENFWSQVTANLDGLAELQSADDAAYDRALDALHEIHAELFLQVSGEARGIIITAEGDAELFPLVDEIVAAAPPLEGWKIHALVPKLGLPKVVQFEGVTVPMKEIAFDPLGREGSNDLGLRLLVPKLTKGTEEAAHNALLQALDHALGERVHAEKIAYTEVARLPQGKTPADFIPLTDLEAYLTWHEEQPA